MSGWEAGSQTDEYRARALDAARDLSGEYSLDMLSTRIMQALERAYLAGMQSGLAEARKVYRSGAEEDA